jgi:hypothetical protein
MGKIWRFDRDANVSCEPVTEGTPAVRKNWYDQQTKSEAKKLGKRRTVMANVRIKSGGYTIATRKTQEFTFWWGADYYPAGYFDVNRTERRGS